MWVELLKRKKIATQIQTRTSLIIPGNILHLSRLKPWLPMVASTVYKGNRRQLLLVLSDLTSHSQFREKFTASRPCTSSPQNSKQKLSFCPLLNSLRQQPKIHDAIPGEMTSEKRTQKFHTGNVYVTSQNFWVVLLIGRAARVICFGQSKALPRSG